MLNLNVILKLILIDNTIHKMWLYPLVRYKNNMTYIEFNELMLRTSL